MALKTWSKPTLPKSTVEDANDATLGWTTQFSNGPTQTEGYAPWVSGQTPIRAADIVNPSVDPTAAKSNTGGALVVDTYIYAYSWQARNGGETLPSNTVSKATTTGSISKITVTVPAKPSWADFTVIYRDVSGTLRRLGTTTTTTFDDVGAVDPTNAQAALTTSTALTAVNH